MKETSLCNIREKVELQTNNMIITEVKKHIQNMDEYNNWNYDFLSKGLSNDKIKFYKNELERLNYLISGVYSGYEDNIPKEIEKILEKSIKKRNYYTSLIDNNNLIIFINSNNLQKFKSLFKITKNFHFIEWDRSDTFYTYGNNILLLTEDIDIENRTILKYKLGVSILFGSEIFKIDDYEQ